MKRPSSPLILAAFLVCPLAASGQPATKFRAGLWEHGFTMSSQSGQMEAAMKQMQGRKRLPGELLAYHHATPLLATLVSKRGDAFTPGLCRAVLMLRTGRSRRPALKPGGTLLA